MRTGLVHQLCDRRLCLLMTHRISGFQKLLPACDLTDVNLVCRHPRSRPCHPEISQHRKPTASYLTYCSRSKYLLQHITLASHVSLRALAMPKTCWVASLQAGPDAECSIGWPCTSRSNIFSIEISEGFQYRLGICHTVKAIACTCSRLGWVQYVKQYQGWVVISNFECRRKVWAVLYVCTVLMPVFCKTGNAPSDHRVC